MISVLIDLTQVAYVQLGMGIIIRVQLIGVWGSFETDRDII